MALPRIDSLPHKPNYQSDRINRNSLSFSSKRLSRQNTGKFEAALIGSFAVLVLIGLLRHELWRDEVQAWLLAIDSATPTELFQNMRTEGHPGLWHLCLHALSYISRDPLTMQLFHGAIATANVSLIALFSPFTRLQKALLSFSYFIFFEYAIISRSYALGLFFLLVFCALYPRYLKRPSLLPFIALGLLANTSLYGLVLSAALSVPLLSVPLLSASLSGDSLIEGSFSKNPLPLSQRFRLPLRDDLSGRSLTLGISLLLASWLLCGYQIVRAMTGEVAIALSQPTETLSWVSAVRPYLRTIALVWRSYVPVPKVWGDRIWGENILSDMRYTPSYEGVSVVLLASFMLSVLLISLVVVLLWHRPRWLAAYGIGTLSILAFSHYVFLGSIRHHGHLFVLLIVCLWLAKADSLRRSHWPGAALSRSLWPLHKPFFTVLLLCQFVGGGALYSIDLFHPFSASRATAEFIQERHLNDYPILGYDDRNTSPLSAYLDQPLYYPNLEKFGRFWRIESLITPAEAVPKISAFVTQQPQPVVLVLTFALTEALLASFPTSLEIMPLTNIESRIVREESYHLYLARSLSAA